MSTIGVSLSSSCSSILLVSKMAKEYSLKKIQKSTQVDGKLEKVDRISKLPDEVICHILSSLPTKEVVATSVLSTRWTSLWTSVCTLDFDDNYVSFSKNNFAFVVNKVLAQRKSKCIKRLSLSSYNNHCKPHLVTTLLSIATNQKIEELNISFFFRLEATLPYRLFTCQTIKIMKLDGNINLNVPAVIHLPLLKILHLSLLYFVDDESLMRLLSGCPVIEELYYEEVKFNYRMSFGICVPSLKRLHIKSCDKRLKINASNLKCLQLEETKTIDYLVENLDNLEEAHLDIFFDHQDEKENIPKLFDGIHKTRFLCLTFCTTEVLTYARIKFPEFRNLVHLQLYLNTLDSYFLVESILKKCPKLEVLDIYKVHEGDNEIQWTQPSKIVPSCLSSHLTAFNFRECGGTSEELKLLVYILKRGKVLKTTTICFANWLGRKERVRFMRKLDALSMASNDYCSIAYTF